MHPAPVVAAVINDVQAIFQAALIRDLRKQAVPQHAPPFRKKAGAGQDAAVGKKGDQAAGSEKGSDFLLEGAAEVRIALQAIDQDVLPLPDFFRIVEAPGTEGGYQAAQAFQRVGSGVAKALQGA